MAHDDVKTVKIVSEGTPHDHVIINESDFDAKKHKLYKPATKSTPVGGDGKKDAGKTDEGKTDDGKTDETKTDAGSELLK